MRLLTLLTTLLLLTACGGNGSGTGSPSITLTEIQVSPTNQTLAAGLVQQYTATGIYSDASSQDITASVIWNSSDMLIAEPGLNGLVTAVDVGSASISANLDGISSDDTGTSATLTVTAAELVSITVSPANPSTPLGVDVNFSATGLYTDASNQDLTLLVTWSSATLTTATISNASGTEGLASPAATGTTIISASLSGISSDDSSTSSTLTVTAADLVSISVSPSSGSVLVGETLQFAALGTYTDSSTQSLTSIVTWASSADATAIVDNLASPGLATGVAAGTVTIDATDADSGISASDTAAEASLNVFLSYKSCKDILINNPLSPDGVYIIDPNGGSTADAFPVNCDMTRDGGGWTLFLKTWYQQPSISGNVGAVGTVSDGLSHKGNSYKLSDADVRLIIGPAENFDILADQSGFNSSYSTGNYEYVILRNYTGYWRFDGVVSPSATTTEFQSYSIPDGAVAHTFNLGCGTTGGWGINCFEVISNNPQGGSGCSINMGTASSAGWHHFLMHETNTDTYLYICNGAQHSSGHDMNHRWWVRER